MFKRILQWSSLLLLLGNYSFAQNFQISGGNAFSTVLCGNGSVYTFGLNDRNQLGRDLTGATYDMYTSVAGLVALPIEIKAIDAGSGAHVLALACNGQVWAWGANDNGQLGDGIDSESYGPPTPGSNSSPADRLVPVAVRAGVTNPVNPMDTLRDIVYISTGTTQSYAITSDSKLLSWGANDQGQLGTQGKGWSFTSDFVPTGDGSDPVEETSLPVWVVNDNLEPLENVIAVDAGDYHAYALVDDDDDGDPSTGRVYAFGGSAYGNPVISGKDEADYSATATLVLDADGNALTGILQITAGDASGFFVQKNTGRVLSVGSDDGGVQAAGPGFDNTDYAKKVLSGDQENYTGEIYLENVTSIAAGQTYGAAVVKRDGVGYLMTWGKQTPYYIGGGDYEGGHLGLGPDPVLTNGGIQTPRYVTFENGDTVKNVISVSDGDAVTYVQTLDPITNETRMYVCGNNVWGQLGLGDDVYTPNDLSDDIEDFETKYYLTEFALPPCKVASPCPVADLTASNEFGCPGYRMSSLLYAGGESPYSSYKWTLINEDGLERDITHDTSRVLGGAYLSASRLGTYIVEITDNRPPEEQTCEACVVTRDEIVIRAADSPFGLEENKFCGDSITFTVNLDSGVDSIEFFDNMSGGVSLGTGVRTDNTVEISVAKEDAYEKSYIEANIRDDEYAIWIENKTTINGTFASEVANCTVGNSTEPKTASHTQLIEVKKNLELNSAKINLKGFSASTVVTFTPVIYKSAIDPNRKEPVPMSGASLYYDRETIWEGDPVTIDIQGFTEADYEITFGNTVNGVFTPLELDGTEAEPEYYWIGVEADVTTGYSATLYGCGLETDFPYVDDLDKDIASLVGLSKYGSIDPNNDESGFLHTFDFTVRPGYMCERTELTAQKSCAPCNGIAPTSLIVNASRPNMCESVDPIDLTFTATPTFGSNEAQIMYQWFKKDADGDVPVTEELSLSANVPVTVDEVGEYYVTFHDDFDTENIGCHTEKSVKIAGKPTYEFSEGYSICEGDDFQDVVLTLEGRGPWTYKLGTGEEATVGTEVMTSTEVVFTPTGSYTYNLMALSDANCDADVSVLKNATVAVGELPPSVEMPSFEPICQTTKSVDLIEEIGYEYLSFSNSSVDDQGVFTIPFITEDTVFYFYTGISDETGACTIYDDFEIPVKKNEEVSFFLENGTCEMHFLDLDDYVSHTGGVFSVEPEVEILSGNEVSTAYLVSGTNYIFTYTFSDEVAGCAGSIDQLAFFNQAPSLLGTESFEITAPQEQTVTGTLSVTPTVDGVVYWIDPDGNEMTAEQGNTSITVTHSSDYAVYEYQAFQKVNDCVSDTVSVFFSIHGCNAKAPVLEDGYFCIGVLDRVLEATEVRDGDMVAWLPLYESASTSHPFVDRAIDDPEMVLGNEFIVISDEVGTFGYQVASYDPVNACWSEAVTVNVTQKELLNTEITTLDNKLTFCAKQTTPIEFEFSPSPDGESMYHKYLKVNGEWHEGLELIPADYAQAGDLEIEFHVADRVTPEGYYKKTGCGIRTAKPITISIANPKAPVVADIVTGLTPPYHPFEATSSNEFETKFVWCDLNGNVLHEDANTFNLFAEDGPAKSEYKVKVVEVTPEGCVSDSTEATVQLLGCTVEAPIVTNTLSGCHENIIDSTNALFVSNESMESYSESAEFSWYNAEGELIQNGSYYRPLEITPGTQTVYVEVEDIMVDFGETCVSPRTELEFTVYPTPDVEILGTVDTLFTTDASLRISGMVHGSLDDREGEGRFIFNGGSIWPTNLYYVDPSILPTGDFDMVYEFTNQYGCYGTSDEYTIHIKDETVNEIDIVTEYMEIITNLEYINGSLAYTFYLQGVPMGYDVYWYHNEPGSATEADADAEGLEYTYSSFPIEPIDHPTGPDEYEYTLFVKLKKYNNGALSDAIPITLTLIDCPVPRPITEDVYTCDKTDLPEISAELASSIYWPGGVAVDKNTTLEYSLNGKEFNISTGTYQFTNTELKDENTVWFRATSPMYNCSSLSEKATLQITEIEPPAVFNDVNSTCSGHMDEIPNQNLPVWPSSQIYYGLSATASPGDYILWYADKEGRLQYDGSPRDFNEEMLKILPGYTQHLYARSIREINGKTCSSDLVEVSIYSKPTPLRPVIQEDDFASTLDNESVSYERYISVSEDDQNGVIKWYYQDQYEAAQVTGEALQLVSAGDTLFYSDYMRTDEDDFVAVRDLDGCMSDVASHTVYNVKTDIVISDIACSVFPNPVENSLTINNETGTVAEYRLLFMSGVVLHSGSIDGQAEIIVNVSSLPAGMYVVEVANTEGLKQFLIEKL